VILPRLEDLREAAEAEEPRRRRVIDLVAGDRPDDSPRPERLHRLEGLIDRETQQHYGDVATFWVAGNGGGELLPGRSSGPSSPRPGRQLQRVGRHADLKFRRQVGAAVWMFPGNDLRAVLMAEQHLQGIPVWVEVDDNYTVDPPLLETSVWARNRKESRSTGQHDYETHVKIVRSKAVDGVICSTPKLAEVYSRLHRTCVCARTVLTPPIGRPRNHPHSPDGVLRVGWAGSASHGYDLADIHRALDWASRQPDVEVVVFGELRHSGAASEHSVDGSSLEEYRENVSPDRRDAVPDSAVSVVGLQKRCEGVGGVRWGAPVRSSAARSRSGRGGVKIAPATSLTRRRTF
jgi:hypothetical protein